MSGGGRARVHGTGRRRRVQAYAHRVGVRQTMCARCFSRLSAMTRSNSIGNARAPSRMTRIPCAVRSRTMQGRTVAALVELDPAAEIAAPPAVLAFLNHDQALGGCHRAARRGVARCEKVSGDCPPVHCWARLDEQGELGAVLRRALRMMLRRWVFTVLSES